MILTLGPLWQGPVWRSVPICSPCAGRATQYCHRQRAAYFSAAVVVDLFWLLYSIVPTIRVPNRDAIVARLSPHSCSKQERKVSRFIYHVPVISAHLRRAGGDPHSLVWVYWTWCIVLLGAEITVTLGNTAN